MNPIKITEENSAAIEAALKAVNGRACQHAYTAYLDLEVMAEAAEKRLEKMGLPKSRRSGAAWSETSGAAVSNSYAKKGFSRPATSVRLERRSSAWYLVSAIATTIGQQGGGAGRLILTKAQDEEVVRNLRESYSVAG